MVSTARILGFALTSSLVLAGLLAQGCDDFLHPRRYNGPGGGTLPYADGGASDGSDVTSCSNCVSGYCMTQALTCFQNTDCGNILSCVESYCPATSSQIVACIGSDPAGTALYDTVRSCEQNVRATTCSAECAGLTDICRYY